MTGTWESVNSLSDNVNIIFARSLKLMMLLLRLGQTSYHSDGEPRWEREGGRRGREGTKEG